MKQASLNDVGLAQRRSELQKARGVLEARRDRAIRASSEAAAEEMALRNTVGVIDVLIEETQEEIDRRAFPDDEFPVYKRDGVWGIEINGVLQPLGDLEPEQFLALWRAGDIVLDDVEEP